MKKASRKTDNAQSVENKQLELPLSTSTKKLCELRYALNAQMQLDYILILWRITPEAHADSTMFAAGRAYTPAKKKAYMKLLVLTALEELNRHKEIKSILPITKSLVASWCFICQKPKSVSHMYEYTYKETRPDTDGLHKTPKDCIQNRKLFKLSKDNHFYGAGFIGDDAIIVKETVVKAYGQRSTGISVLLKPAGREFVAPKYIKEMLAGD